MEKRPVRDVWVVYTDNFGDINYRHGKTDHYSYKHLKRIEYDDHQIGLVSERLVFHTEDSAKVFIKTYTF